MQEVETLKDGPHLVILKSKYIFYDMFGLENVWVESGEMPNGWR